MITPSEAPTSPGRAARPNTSSLLSGTTTSSPNPVWSSCMRRIWPCRITPSTISAVVKIVASTRWPPTQRPSLSESVMWMCRPSRESVPTREVISWQPVTLMISFRFSAVACASRTVAAVTEPTVVATQAPRGFAVFTHARRLSMTLSPGSSRTATKSAAMIAVSARGHECCYSPGPVGRRAKGSVGVAGPQAQGGAWRG
mmetsp:Transcript_15178/g.45664  ORF Transcript_15178/g.45664 Transcript_15178/m.45664 type:complete len:200 (+) Transcript_15178:1768-2367(+)